MREVYDSKPENMFAADQESAIGESLHDLSQPLTSINNFAQAGLRLCNANPDGDPEINKLFEYIHEEARRASEICRKIPR